MGLLPTPSQLSLQWNPGRHVIERGIQGREKVESVHAGGRRTHDPNIIREHKIVRATEKNSPLKNESPSSLIRALSSRLIARG